MNNYVIAYSKGWFRNYPKSEEFKKLSIHWINSKNDLNLSFLDKLKPKFAAILDDFIPRYVEILTSGRFKESIKEIRVEGHTSTFWTTATTNLDAYFKNMELSQARTRSTLERILTSNAATDHQEWLKKRLTANGLSSSQPIVGKDGIIDEKASQRVEFRIVTNADENISKIANTLDKNEDI